MRRWRRPTSRPPRRPRTPSTRRPPGGDAAQKAYSPTGLDLQGEDGENLGVEVDPSDLQPGDVLRWQDKTMVAVAPGLIADPHAPWVTHPLAQVLADRTGFEGVFRPTVSASSPAPSATVPQAAPPSPFEAASPPRR